MRRSAEHSDRVVVWAGAGVSLFIAVALFSRFSIDDTLSRDEAVHAYAGQQQAEGIPPYASIFDPKTPLSSMIAGAGVAVGRVLGVDDVYAMRLAFFLFACAAVPALYLLAVWLFASPLVGIASAATFASFEGFALDALTGPSAKTPGIFFAVLSMGLLVRRRYFWGAFAGSFAFLVWQPLGVYAAVAIGVALLNSGTPHRWKRCLQAFAGAAIPIAVTAAYFSLAGAMDELVDATLGLALTGVVRNPESLLERFERMIGIVNYRYGLGGVGVLFWSGLGMLLAVLGLRVARRRSDLGSMAKDDPYVNIVFASFLPLAAFTALDFQGYPDLYPALAYAAVGIGGGLSVALSRIGDIRLLRIAAAGTLAAALGVIAVSWVAYSADRRRDTGLVEQRAVAARVEELLDRGETLYAIGSPVPLVLLQRRNPSPFINLTYGMDRWMVEHLPGGFESWTKQIRAYDPETIILGGPWRSRYAQRTEAWLMGTYPHIGVGRFLVFAKRAIWDRGERRGLLPHNPR